MTEPTPRPKRHRRAPFADAIGAYVERASAASAEKQDALWREEWDARIGDKSRATREAYASKYRTALRAALGDSHPAVLAIDVLDREDTRVAFDDARSNAGRKPTLRDAIAAFVETAVQLDKTRRAGPQKGADGRFRRALSGAWRPLIKDWRRHKAPSTVLSDVSRVRKTLSDAGIADEHALAVVKAPDDLQRLVVDARRKEIVSRQRSLIPFPSWRDLLDAAIAELPDAVPPNAIEATAKRLAADIDRDDLVRLGLALSVITGRRYYEIFAVGSVSLIPLSFGDSPAGHGGRIHSAVEKWRVSFVGQAKTRAREGTQFDRPFPIATLTDAKRVVLAWSILRQSAFGRLWFEMTADEFKTDLLRTPGRSAILPGVRADLFGPYWPGGADVPLTMSNVRTLYAEIADTFFRPRSASKQAYIASILGHGDDDLETAFAYVKFYLPDQKSSGPGAREIRRLAGAVERSEAERSGS